MGKRLMVGLVMAIVPMLASVVVILAQAGEPAPIYLDPKRPVEERVADLMGRMTLKEKVGQLNLPCVYVDGLGKDIPSKMRGVQEIRGWNLHAGNWAGLRIFHSRR